MTATVDQARRWADFLVHAETRGPGDHDRAMRRVASKLGVSFSALWGLRYRAPKDVVASLYVKLSAGYEAEVERQAKAFLHELELARASQGATASPLVRAAAAVSGVCSNESV